MNEHPSQYALDRAALGAATPAVAAHLRACPRCTELLVARRAPVELPGWLAGVRAPPPGPPRPRWRWPWVVAPAFAVAAAALLATAGVATRAPDRLVGDDGATREKGAPRVAVYVKRGDAVVAWDGRAPIRPGDRLRVGIRAPGYGRVSVASVPAPPARPEVLWAGPLGADGETLLPASFRVDDRGGAEVLSVIVSARDIDPAAHEAASLRDPAALAVRLTLRKEPAP